MLNHYGLILLLHIFHETSAGMPWSSSSQLSRVPGLTPYSPRIAFPQFLAMGGNSASSRGDMRCDRISPGCPKSCIQVDKSGCAICTCTRHDDVTGGCPEPPSTCPSACRKRERGCNVCQCGESTSSGSSSILTSSHVSTKCFSMVMCMLTCKIGYKLGEIIDNKGCQTCHCIDGQPRGDKTGSSISGTSGQSHTEQGSSVGSQHSGNTDWSSSSNTDSWGSGSGGAAGSGQTWSSGTSGSGNGSPGWDNISQGVGGTGESCSGPMCPGASSSGINPMNPGVGLSGGGSGCTGPFCAGDGGGGSGGSGSEFSTGGSGGCTGPFCISGGMSGGIGSSMGSGVSGGMSSGGMGGGMGGMMSGTGGTGGFSPFGLAASGGGANSNGGGASGCNGPFCTMTSSGLGGAITDEHNSGGDNNCKGPSCSAKDGYHYR